jgi:hypothetical protein
MYIFGFTVGGKITDRNFFIYRISGDCSPKSMHTSTLDLTGTFAQCRCDKIRTPDLTLHVSFLSSVYQIETNPGSWELVRQLNGISAVQLEV